MRAALLCASLCLAGCSATGEPDRKLGSATTQENLKKIAEAIRAHHANLLGARMPRAITDKEGRPLLSWRVAILPFLGDNERLLAGKFHRDEPWDSPHNLSLLSLMPTAYRMSNDPAADGYKTCCLLPVGRHAIFPSGPPPYPTIRPEWCAVVVEADESAAVPWTKPGDLEMGDAALPSGLGGRRQGRLLIGTWGGYGAELDFASDPKAVVEHYVRIPHLGGGGGASTLDGVQIRTRTVYTRYIITRTR